MYHSRIISDKSFDSVADFISNHRSDLHLWSNSIDVGSLDGDDLILEDITLNTSMLIGILEQIR